MTANGSEWNPFDSRSWARFLGLVHVPMFGKNSASHPGNHSVLLDGDVSSFSLSITDEAKFAFDTEPLSWAWSSNLRHTLIIQERTGEMFLRRWDGPSGAARRFRIASKPSGAFELLDIFKKSSTPRHDDVVLFVLRAFRTIRNSLSSPDGLDSIKALTVLLLGTESVRKQKVSESDWRACRTIRDATARLDRQQVELLDLRLNETTFDSFLGESLFDHFLNPEPLSGCLLEPDLLLRHASGQLYQEAHLHLEKEVRQLYLPGLAPDTPSSGILMKDVRFTPPSLARVIVEQALDALTDFQPKMPTIEILDPACGTGIFLQETIRELAQRSYQGKLTVRGFDKSAISCTIARFCLNRAKQDSSLANVTIEIVQQDSLRSDWGRPDIIFMNPPFIPWERMAEQSQQIVQETLGTLARFRPDMAMAFIWKAAKTLSDRAILASVLPTPLFETQSGEQWREALAELGDLTLLGRFEGYGFFRGSIVEPGMLMLARYPSEEKARRKDVKIVIAKSGHEDEAIRGLRQDADRSSSPAEWDVFHIDSAVVTSASWMPRFREVMRRIEILAERGLTTVGDLFTVHQGTLTGYNKAFVLSVEEIDSLPKKERALFRPIASNSTIHDGRVQPTEFVFYPYDGSGEPLLNSQEDLRKQVPRYATGWLFPHQAKLKERQKIGQNKWWLLTRPRSWQFGQQPKLVSTYFGDRGSFAFDADGAFVVLQGYGWLWKKKKTKSAPHFMHSPLPWAYLALLNSGVFENLLEGACPRVQGGQFNLSTRFVNRIFLPDLSDDMQVTGQVVEELARIGREIHAGKRPAVEKIDKIVAQAYGLPH